MYVIKYLDCSQSAERVGAELLTDSLLLRRASTRWMGLHGLVLDAAPDLAQCHQYW